MKTKTRASKGTPTLANLRVLADAFAGGESISCEVSPADLPHLARCLKAGLIVAADRKLALTDAGRAGVSFARSLKVAR